MEPQTMTDESNTEAEPSAEENSASDSLDDLLKDYETPDKPEKPPEVVQPDPERDRILNVVSRYEKEATERDIQASVKVAKSFAGSEDVREEDIEAHLWMMAGKDKRFADAFEKRDERPDEWRKMLKAVGEKFTSRPDQKATSDWRAMESAVHSASSSTPEKKEEPSVGKMTDSEFVAYKQKLFGR